jgi:drug/metabolite transporter (DMT)-like permease
VERPIVNLHRNTWLFLLLCVIWGTTWIGIKAGVEAVPAMFFAGTRFTAAGLILLAIGYQHDRPRFARRDLARVGAASLLMITLCYGPLFWAMRFIDSGTTAVLELSLTPIALMLFAVMLKEERFAWRKMLALALGVAGLMVLFGPAAVQSWSAPSSDSSGSTLSYPGTSAATQVMGMLAIAGAAFSYGWGSAVAGPLLRAYPARLVAGATMAAGGLVLLALSFAFEPGATRALRFDWGLAAWSGWLFLVFAGSLVGYSVYMRLLRDIGASRAGTYAFVSPVIAVLLGVAVHGETVGGVDVVGMVIMLGAAWLAMDMSGKPAALPRPEVNVTPPATLREPAA